MCVRRYHVYQALWIPVIGEELVCVREPRIAADRYMLLLSQIIIALTDSEPFESGRPSVGLKYCQIDMLTPPHT